MVLLSVLFGCFVVLQSQYPSKLSGFEHSILFTPSHITPLKIFIFFIDFNHQMNNLFVYTKFIPIYEGDTYEFYFDYRKYIQLLLFIIFFCFAIFYMCKKSV